jgi:beta-1,4-N-acetylglucosaminyltransferase
MIFVTVGTTRFDELVRQMDDIAPMLGEEVVIQMGSAAYEPLNCKAFRFKEGLGAYLRLASLVVSHGGAGNLFGCLEAGKKVVGVANPHVIDNHQRELLEKLSERGHVVWCKDLALLHDAIQEARTKQFFEYKKPECFIEEVILGFLTEGSGSVR